MHMPKYSEYTLKELHQALNSLNREKYPDRLKIIERELDMRTEAGDVVLDTKHSEIFPSDIPLSLGFRAWWCFFWRSTLATLAFVILVSTVIGALTNLLGPFSGAGLILTKGILIIVTPVFGTFFMMQALAKRYEGHRIIVARNDDV